MPLQTKTALVLAGGGSLGAIQAGMLEELCAAGVRFDFLAGASVGAINAGFFAADPTLAGARKLAAIWRSITRTQIMPMTAGSAMNIVFRRGYIFDNSALRALLVRHIPYRRLEHAAIPLCVVATDALNGEEVALCEGPVVDAILASAAIPGIFPPVQVNGRELVDGGIANNTPISTAIRLGATRIIVLPTGFACALGHAPSGAAARAMNAVSLLIARQLVGDIERYGSQVEICVVPSLCPLDVSPYDYSACAGLVDRSEARTRHWIAAGGLEKTGVPESLREHHH